jgi:hypothetical protein
MNHDKLIPGIIALAGGQITTRIRLRMIHYLLDQKGMQSSALWYYSIRDHGPYSHDFEQSLLNAIHFDLVQETTGRRASDGAAYTIFATTQPQPPSILAALASEPAKDLILRIMQQSATILELAASAHWFIIHEQDPDWKTTLRHRKGALADNGRLETAAAFLHVLDLLPSAH